jgi:glycosyltransferase involved in cell wall biosynthesis
MWRLLRRLRQNPPDVIHFQWLPLPVVDQTVIGAFSRIAPLVLTVHDTDPFNGDPTSRIQRVGYANCLRQFNRLIVHTQQGRERMLTQGIAAERLAVMPHGPLTPRTADVGDTMTGPITFILFGKIKAYKGVDVMIKAFAMLPAALRAQARVRIVGKPYMDLAPLRDLAVAEGVADQFSFEPGFIEDDAVNALFGEGTVAVFPYREIETSGVLFLALAQGRPVVASDLGSFGEILQDGSQGHLVPPGDCAALSNSLAHMIADRDFAAACASAAWARAGKIPAWSEIAGDTAQVYRAAGAGTAMGDAGRSRAIEISNSTIKIMGGNC